MTSKTHLELLKLWADRQKEVLYDIDVRGFDKVIDNESYEDWLREELNFVYSLIRGFYLSEIEDLEEEENE